MIGRISGILLESTPVQALVEAGARCVSVLTFARATGRLRLD